MNTAPNSRITRFGFARIQGCRGVQALLGSWEVQSWKFRPPVLKRAMQNSGGERKQRVAMAPIAWQEGMRSPAEAHSGKAVFIGSGGVILTRVGLYPFNVQQACRH